MIRPSFSKLRSNYYISPTSTHACKMQFPNTCAIRMSEALVRANPKFMAVFKKSIKNKCPHGYIRGAQDLAAILAKPSVFGPRDCGWEAQASVDSPPDDIMGKKGIVCYMTVPTYPDGQGHIDLWDDDRKVGAQRWNAETIWMWELP